MKDKPLNKDIDLFVVRSFLDGTYIIRKARGYYYEKNDLTWCNYYYEDEGEERRYNIRDGILNICRTIKEANDSICDYYRQRIVKNLEQNEKFSKIIDKLR